MTAATWLAAAILGPGAIALFVWFLRDLRALVAEDGTEEAGPNDPPAPGGEGRPGPGPA